MRQSGKLSLDWPEEISMAGIVASCKEHKLAYEINLALGLSLSRSIKDIEIYTSEKTSSTSGNLFEEDIDDGISTHSIFEYTDKILYRRYCLLSNLGSSGWLLPELKNLNFVLLLETSYLPENTWQDIIAAISGISDVNNIFFLDPEKVPSKFNLLF
ncbi:MAG: IPExxxVDY family protein [Bacteroidota bacterium]|jgi:hypothetical protein